MICKETIKKILSVSCIEDVIGDFVELKKSGLNYRGLSPFSNEKTPSFIVSPTKKIWKDFSSGKGGNIITFLMEHEHFTYVESLRYLAKRYHIKIQYTEEFSKIDHEEYEKLYFIQDYAKRFFINQLFCTKEGQKNGFNYLIQKRGFNMKIIHKFELGYAPLSWSFFTKKALEKGFKIQDLKKSGFTIYRKYSNNFFDCFRKRVMFPIHNLSGRVIGFGGRNIDSSSSYSTKYINSSESDIFQKSKILYGLFQAKKNILKEDLCYLVEGYTDVLSLHQSGIKNVVSSSGISLTVDQILLIKKFTKNIVLFYDGDRSGIKASLRGINMILEQGINLRILFISNGEDPDSLSKKYSISQLKDFLAKNSYNFISFKQKIYGKFHQDDPIKKSFFVLNILNSISKISNVLQKELYLQEASKMLQIRQKILINELERINKKNGQKLRTVQAIQAGGNNQNTNTLLFIEKELIQLILNHGNKIIKKEKCNTTVLEEILYAFKYWNLRFSLNKNQEIFDKICLQNKKIGHYKLNNTEFSDKENPKFYSLSKWDKKGIKVSSFDDHIDQYITDILLRYRVLYISKLIKKEIIHITKDDDRLKKIMDLTNVKNEIHKKLHRYV
ncbi:DNA primase [Blattabacterium sp. (Blattella germanica) str. Bge]|uniref:DNA primase n=1 Tax=Blattabacterium sp. (Blattella germanica) TaxID=624186 RepID=UPI0001BB619D|nr:DNA primase [Blattabacterium sp. (Blattella germanica)]ACY40359.1 DNA primase [Blattabacterium sp. (Blattella germanica) str. Bge]